MTLLIIEDDVKQLPLSIKAAIPIIEDTFRQAGEGSAENPPRFRMPFRFASHGLAINDVAMTVKTYELAKVKGIGTEINLG